MRISKPLKLSILSVICAGAMTTFSTAQAAPPVNQHSNGKVFASGRILVMPKAGLPDTEFAKILNVHGGRAHKIGQSSMHIVDIPFGQEEKIVSELSANSSIKFAELDLLVKSKFTANDPYFGSQYHLPRVGAPTAWDTTQGAGITIAILDSGVDGTHPDLVPNLVPGYNFIDSNTNTADVCGHGTAVAGTAAAVTNNGVGVAGVAGQAHIMPLRIATYDTTNGCYSYYSTITSGVTYAADHGARIANASYGGVAGSSSIQNAAQYMQSKGGLLFVSAGNNGINENITPTTTLIAVSATDSNDALTSWSSYGSFVSLSAPGAGIYTTSNGGIYQAWSGTSFSSPLTAGVGALMMAANPALDAPTIQNLMFKTAVDLGAPGRDIYYGYGRVDAAAGVAAAKSATVATDVTPPTASITSPAANASVTGIVSVNVNATDNVGVSRVDLSVNGTVVASDIASPYTFAWDSRGAVNGMASLVATAYDAAGNVASSNPVSVNVYNCTPMTTADTIAPTVMITNPVAGAVSGTVNVTTNASDNNCPSGITQTLQIDGAKVATGTGSTLSYSWNTKKVKLGSHTITAIAKDAAGNQSSSSVVVKR